MNTRKIFVGSSLEGWRAAEAVGKVIRQAGMEPVLWKTIFPAGDITLEKIEQLPNLVDGAILVVTPDLTCNRMGKNEGFSAPVQNIIFEYGYLSARLSRRRVAICKFEDAEIPSDLQGMTLVLAGKYAREGRLNLPGETKKGLQRWLGELTPLAAGIVPIYQVHGYSGTWNVQNRFSLWHGIELGDKDTVSFDGKTFLHLRADGQEGYGNQIGQLKVNIGQYKAKWEVATGIIRAVVDQRGFLKMRLQVYIRVLAEENGVPPNDRVREPLPSPEWDLVLEPIPGEPTKLKANHVYRVATFLYSIATEIFTYTGA